MKYSNLHISVIGSSHIKNGKECQDCSYSESQEKFAIAIVSDGHGGDKYIRSSRGSKMACECCLKAILEYLKFSRLKANRGKECLSQLEKNIIYSWNLAIQKDYNNDPFSDEEINGLTERDKLSINENISQAYGATLIAVVIGERFSFGIQIGDGDCVVLKKDGDVLLPIPDDDRLQFNITTSLCGDDALNDFREFWIDEPIAAAVVSTDGVLNSFVGEEYYIKFCRTVVDATGTDESTSAVEELKEFLTKLSNNGSNDDVSIAVVKNNDLVAKWSSIQDTEGNIDKA